MAAGVAGCSSLGGGGGDSGDGTGGDDTTEGSGTDPGGSGTTTDGSGTTADTTATTTDDSGDGTTASDGDGTEDGGGDDGTADPSTVAFDLGWQEDFDFDGRISSRNFGADATADGVFIGGEWGFAGLGLEDGSRMWETGEFDGFLDVHADSRGVVAYTNSFEVVSLDPAEGTERWRASASGSEEAFYSTALAPSYFVAESAEGIAVYDRGSGEVVAEVDVASSPRGIVATDDALVVLQSGETAVYDVTSGSERWRKELIVGVGAAVDDGRLVGLELGVGPDASNALTAVDLGSGDRIWTEETGTGRGTGVRTDGRVAAWMTGGSFGEEGTLHAHDLDGGTELWTKGVGRVSEPFAAIDSGVVLAPTTTENNRAKVRAYGARSGERLAETDGGLSVVEAAAVDRTYLEIELSSVTAIEF